MPPNGEQRRHWKQARFSLGFCTSTSFFSASFASNVIITDPFFSACNNSAQEQFLFRSVIAMRLPQNKIDLVLFRQRMWHLDISLETLSLFKWRKRVEISIFKHLPISSIEIFGLFTTITSIASPSTCEVCQARVWLFRLKFSWPNLPNPFLTLRRAGTRSKSYECFSCRSSDAYVFPKSIKGNMAKV